MAPVKRRPCSVCNKMHGCHSNECRNCRRQRDIAAKIRYCVMCESVVPRGRSHSQYCSLTCVTSISYARSCIGNRIAQLVRSGEIPPAKTLVCVDCGGSAREYEHREYLRPLDVVPVCRSCNLKRGPALDVKAFVARNLGVSISDLSATLVRKRKESEELRNSWLSGRIPCPYGKGRPLVDHSAQAAA